MGNSVHSAYEKVLFLARSRQVTEIRKLGKHGTQYSSPAMTLEFTEILKHISTAMLTFLGNITLNVSLTQNCYC